MFAVKSDRRGDCHDDHRDDSLSELSMKLWTSYPRAHPRSSFTGHGTGVL